MQIDPALLQHLTPEELKELDGLLRGVDPERMSLIQFAQDVARFQNLAPHHERLASALQRVVDGSCRRLIVSMPPRFYKSNFGSVLLPAYYIGCNPDHRIIHASYSAALSNSFSRRVRNLVMSEEFQEVFPHVRIAKDSRAVDKWDIAGSSGGFLSLGRDGPVTGAGANLMIMDDLLRGAEEARSEAVKESAWAWFRQDAYTRLEPDGALVILGTRWAEDDPIGRALAETDDCYEQLVLPAEHPDGSALWPEKFPLSVLNRIRAAIGDEAYQTLYMCSPVPEGGGRIQASWFKTIQLSDVPREALRAPMVIGVDLAVSLRASADWTVLQPMIYHEGRYYLFPSARFRAEMPDIVKEIKAMLELYPRCRHVGIEAVAAQRYVAQSLRRELPPGINVLDIKVSRDKISRAGAWTPSAEAGQFHIVTNGTNWSRDLLQELSVFPAGRHDDQVDAISVAHETLKKAVRGAVVVDLPYA